MILKYTYENDIFSFYFLNVPESKVLVSKWDELQLEFLSQLAILKELHDNGWADYTDVTCEVKAIDILKLSEIDKKILDLPEIYPYEILIESDGILSKDNFKFKYGFYDFAPNGTRLGIIRKGVIVEIGETEYLFSENQYLICKAIDEFNNLSNSEKGVVKNLKKLSEIKALSKESGLTLEQFLNNQELFIPEKIKLDINFNNECLEIIPTVEIDNAIDFTNTFDKFPEVRNIYPIGKDSSGKTTRVIISEKQKIELQKIKQKRKISEPQEIQDIIEHPELFFNDDEVDFTVFYSDRVKEIGVYKPKYYPFTSPYQTQWIPGIVVKDKIHGEKKIYFKSVDVLRDFICQKEKAVGEQKQTLQWENIEIPIEEAENFIKIAKGQFANPHNPIRKENQREQEVLIIKENAELTEFFNSNKSPKKLIHSFCEISNLISGINLKEHQKEGVAWLQSLIKEKCSGCLLADDMGLGKTLQLLYFIEWHSQTYPELNKPYLIVAPVGLLENWENEYQKFFNPRKLQLCKLHDGVSLTKGNDPCNNQKDAKKLQFKQIILTNYEIVRLYQISLGLVDFAIIALDEAQKIKTPGTLITNASKALKADFKIAMTGTPVENTLVDIWCLLDFAVPGLLGNAKDFAKKYQKPLRDGNINIKTLTEQLRNNIGVFIKRRLKSDVAKDLPDKYDNSDSRIRKEMPLIQLNRYKQEIKMANNPALAGINKRNQKLKSIWAIRDISDHPYLMESQILNFTSEELIASSSKLETTIIILKEIESKKEKVILFADRRETQKMLQKVVYDIFTVFVSIINGDTPTTKQSEEKSKLSRQQTIDRFQSKKGFNAIIMSPIAAGIGLNVTEANHIIHYTRHWNPAKEEQATSRAYRIGQQKDVFVYYPMAIFTNDMKDEDGERLKSFDEILDTLLINKKELASNMLFPTEQAEIIPDELFENIFGTNTESRPNRLLLEDIDRLYPNLFEAGIATLFEKQGFIVYLTPYSNDKGVDVVVMKNRENYLIQAKQTKSLVGISAIQEIFTAKKYYEDKFREKFNLLIITNNDYSPSARSLAGSNGVKLYNRTQLDGLVNQNYITIEDISKIETQRLLRI